MSQSVQRSAPPPDTVTEQQTAPRSILVVVDPTTQEQPAVAKAVAIAATSGARLEFYVCDVEQDVPESWAGAARGHQFREARRMRILDDLHHLAAPHRARGLAVDLGCEWHAPLEQGIGYHVIRSKPDLVVKGTSRHPAAPRVALTRTDWQLIRQIPVPLLLVGPNPWASTPIIAAAVDPCHVADHPATLDAGLVAQAATLARNAHGKVEIFHVLQTPPHLPGDQVTAEQKAVAHIRACTAVQQLAVRAGAAAIRFARGRVVEGLAELVATHGADVLAMGAVSRPRWVHSAASGTAAQLLERVSCDLLVVKPPGFVSPLLVTDE